MSTLEAAKPTVLPKAAHTRAASKQACMQANNTWACMQHART